MWKKSAWYKKNNLINCLKDAKNSKCIYYTWKGITEIKNLIRSMYKYKECN